eukprot:505068-Pyramimonas_sp.AAC.1
MEKHNARGDRAAARAAAQAHLAWKNTMRGGLGPPRAWRHRRILYGKTQCARGQGRRARSMGTA